MSVTFRLPFILAALAGLAGCATVPPAPAAPVEVAIIAINDFHGNLEPPRRSVTAQRADGSEVSVPAGGAAYLAGAIASLRARHRHSAVVSAGDMIGASPLASGYFLDEPAIQAMNLAGVEFNALGNHEFDRGRAEVLRIQNGGCEKTGIRNPCALEPFAGARFRQLAANTLAESGQTLLPGTALKTFGSGPASVTVGFIGVTTKATSTLVSPDGIAGLTFADEAATINAAVPALRASGADAVVVLIHEGGSTEGGYNDKSCPALSGAIVPILEGLSVKVDAVVSGHTHRAYVCQVARGDAGPTLLTSAGSAGTLVTEIVLAIDPASGAVEMRRADNHIVQGEGYSDTRGAVPLAADVPRFDPQPEVAALVARYVAASREAAARPVGRLAGPAERAMHGPGPRLVADAQLAASRSAGAVLAFTNPFGVRTDLVPSPDGTVTYGQLYAMQPFANTLVTMTLTGAQIRAALEQGLADPANTQWLAPSANVSYRYDMTRPAGARIREVTVDGQPLDPARAYRVTVNSFLSTGGDGYAAFREGTDRTVGVSDLEALEMWLDDEGVRPVPAMPRALDDAR